MLLLSKLKFQLQNKKLINDFHNLGYARLGKIFTPEEISCLRSAINESEDMTLHLKNVRAQVDKGKYPSFETIFVMNDVTSNSIFSLACRKPRIIDFVSLAFGSDAYLYHSKVPLKYPGIPGFKYHQDYFYWYNMGCIFPTMATCFIAIDEATRENGCLKYIPKSHLCGRIEHKMNDGISDSEADPERVKILKDKFGEDEIILAPGEVVIHHSNTLHSSEANNSNAPRLALLGCFNVEKNDPITDFSDHPKYQKQERFFGKLNKISSIDNNLHKVEEK